MAAGIASGFVRKLYRILDQESDAIISWDASGTSFSIYDSAQLNDQVLPRYFRGRLSAFRQQLIDHGFERLECEDDEKREVYCHPDFLRGCPGRLSQIVRNPRPKQRKNQGRNQGNGNGNGNAKAGGRRVAVGAVSAVMSELQLTSDSPTPGSLSVHITAGAGGAKRSSPTNMQHAMEKRQCMNGETPMLGGTASAMMMGMTMPGEESNVLVPGLGMGFSMPTAKNPLFSNDPAMDVDVARVFSLGRMSENGLLPPSTDLPEPISYLSNMQPAVPSTAAIPTATTTGMATAPMLGSNGVSTSLPLANVDDMMNTMLQYFVSTSTTMAAPAMTTPVATQGEFTRALQATPSIDFHGQSMSTSEFLASFLASSVTGTATGAETLSLSTVSAAGLSAWASSSNPLFSDTSSEEEEDGNAVLNLLVESSVDRVKTAMTQLTSPQDRMKLILEERERLEEQRRKLLAPETDSSNNPPSLTGNVDSCPARMSLKRQASDVPSIQAPPRKTQAVASIPAAASAEDGMLWLLMSSTSVDWLRKSASEFDV